MWLRALIGVKVRSIAIKDSFPGLLCYGHFSRWYRLQRKWCKKNTFRFRYIPRNVPFVKDSRKRKFTQPAINFFHKEILKYNEVSQFQLVIQNRSPGTFVWKSSNCLSAHKKQMKLICRHRAIVVRLLCNHTPDTMERGGKGNSRSDEFHFCLYTIKGETGISTALG